MQWSYQKAVRTAWAALLGGLLVSCRSSGPAPDDLLLVPGMAPNEIHALRSMMRVRVESDGQTQSFRAQLLVEPAARRMRFDAYTPVGTTALTLYAEGDRVVFIDQLNRTAWRGSAQQLAGSVKMLGNASPTDWALAVLGYPQSSGGSLRLEFVDDTTGARQATAMVPAKHVQLFAGQGSTVLADITNVEVYATGASPLEPEIPADYRCCIQPSI